jgi:hypothetical protein
MAVCIFQIDTNILEIIAEIMVIKNSKYIDKAQSAHERNVRYERKKNV